jgi:hypothetical protein
MTQMGDRVEESEPSYKFLVDFQEGEVEERTSSPTSKIEKKATMGEKGSENGAPMRKAASREEWSERKHHFSRASSMYKDVETRKISWS